MTGILSFRGVATAVLIMAVAFAASPALAATTLFGPADDTIINTTAFSSGALDATTYDNLTLSFDFNSTKLDGGQNDSFSYGYQTGGTETVLGTVVGLTSDDPAEIGSISVAIPQAALTADLEVFITVTANSSLDNVVVTNISLAGDLTPVEEETEGGEDSEEETEGEGTEETVTETEGTEGTEGSEGESTEGTEGTEGEESSNEGEEGTETEGESTETEGEGTEETGTETEGTEGSEGESTEGSEDESTEGTEETDTEEGSTEGEESSNDDQSSEGTEGTQEEGSEAAEGDSEQGSEETESTDTDSSTEDTATEGSSSDEAADKCEFEGHKYDDQGNPLTGWEMGLMKIITHNNGVDVYDIDTATTAADGFYCLRWSEDRTIRGESTYVDGPYSFVYRVYEVKQTDWEFVSSEHGADFTNLTVATPDEVTETDTEVQVEVISDSGIVYADAEYHVDFYNQYTGEEVVEFTALTMTSVCREDDGGMRFAVQNSNADTVAATYAVVDSSDTGSVTVAASGETVFTTASSTEVGTTTLSYQVDEVDYSLTVEAISTSCTATQSAGGTSSGSNNLSTSNSVASDGTQTNGSSSNGSDDGSDSDSVEADAGAQPTVAGISDSAVSPEPLVLGEQVSVVPSGGANTGAGSTSPVAPTNTALGFLALAVLALLGARRVING